MLQSKLPTSYIFYSVVTMIWLILENQIYIFTNTIKNVYQSDNIWNPDFLLSCYLRDHYNSPQNIGFFFVVGFMVFNATFNNISAISWQSVLLVEETREPGENPDRPQVTDKLYHIILYTSPWSRFDELTTSVVIGTDCIGSCKYNYHTITATILSPPPPSTVSQMQLSHQSDNIRNPDFLFSCYLKDHYNSPQCTLDQNEHRSSDPRSLKLSSDQ